jgi:RimJ/RimL family protein N-acetyltransferase
VGCVPFDPVPDPRPDDEPWPELNWPVAADTELTGDTVQLSALDPSVDAAELYRVLDHDVCWAHIPVRPTGPDGLARQLEAWCATPGWHPWAVRLRRDVGRLPAGSLVGITSYIDASVAHASLEIGATIFTPEVWAGAVNPDSKLLLLTHAFDELRAGRVQLKTDARNIRSQQAIARLGARHEGTLRRHYRRADGTVRDSVLFSITVDDWPDVRERLVSRLSHSLPRDT